MKRYIPKHFLAKIPQKAKRVTALVLCASMLLSLSTFILPTKAAIDNVRNTTGSEDRFGDLYIREADKNTMDSYVQASLGGLVYLQWNDDTMAGVDGVTTATVRNNYGTRYAGEVWADKSVFALGQKVIAEVRPFEAGHVHDNSTPILDDGELVSGKLVKTFYYGYGNYSDPTKPTVFYLRETKKIPDLDNDGEEIEVVTYTPLRTEKAIQDALAKGDGSLYTTELNRTLQTLYYWLGGGMNTTSDSVVNTTIKTIDDTYFAEMDENGNVKKDTAGNILHTSEAIDSVEHLKDLLIDGTLTTAQANALNKEVNDAIASWANKVEKFYKYLGDGDFDGKNLILGTDTDGLKATISLAEFSDFLHVFSTLGSSQQITVDGPFDVVFVVDVSASMAEDDRSLGYHAGDTWRDGDRKDPNEPWVKVSDTKIYQAIEALNHSIASLMELHPLNRCSVVVFASRAVVLLPLDHYTPGNDSSHVEKGANGSTYPYNPGDDPAEVDYRHIPELTANGWDWPENVTGVDGGLTNAQNDHLHKGYEGEYVSYSEVRRAVVPSTSILFYDNISNGDSISFVLQTDDGNYWKGHYENEIDDETGLIAKDKFILDEQLTLEYVKSLTPYWQPSTVSYPAYKEDGDPYLDGTGDHQNAYRLNCYTEDGYQYFDIHASATGSEEGYQHQRVLCTNAGVPDNGPSGPNWTYKVTGTGTENTKPVDPIHRQDDVDYSRFAYAGKIDQNDYGYPLNRSGLYYRYDDYPYNDWYSWPMTTTTAPSATYIGYGGVSNDGVWLDEDGDGTGEWTGISGATSMDQGFRVGLEQLAKTDPEDLIVDINGHDICRTPSLVFLGDGDPTFLASQYEINDDFLKGELFFAFDVEGSAGWSMYFELNRDANKSFSGGTLYAMTEDWWDFPDPTKSLNYLHGNGQIIYPLWSKIGVTQWGIGAISPTPNNWDNHQYAKIPYDGRDPATYKKIAVENDAGIAFGTILRTAFLKMAVANYYKDAAEKGRAENAESVRLGFYTIGVGLDGKGAGEATLNPSPNLTYGNEANKVVSMIGERWNKMRTDGGSVGFYFADQAQTRERRSENFLLWDDTLNDGAGGWVYDTSEDFWIRDTEKGGYKKVTGDQLKPPGNGIYDHIDDWDYPYDDPQLHKYVADPDYNKYDTYWTQYNLEGFPYHYQLWGPQDPQNPDADTRTYSDYNYDYLSRWVNFSQFPEEGAAWEVTYTDKYGNVKTNRMEVSKAQFMEVMAEGYTDHYFDVQDADDLSDIFAEIVTLITEDPFVTVSGSNSAGFEDSLTYSDPIGDYMTVDSVTDMTLFGHHYKVVKEEQEYKYTGTTKEEFEAYKKSLPDYIKKAIINNSDEKIQNTTYIVYKIVKDVTPGVDKDIETNGGVPVLKNGVQTNWESSQRVNLSTGAIFDLNGDIHIWVEDTGEWRDSDGTDFIVDNAYSMALYVNIDVKALPTQVANIHMHDRGGEVLVDYTTNLSDPKSSTPLRVFYNVSLDPDYLRYMTEKARQEHDKSQAKGVALTKVSPEYLTKNTALYERNYIYNGDGEIIGGDGFYDLNETGGRYTAFYSNYFTDSEYNEYPVMSDNTKSSRGNATVTFSPSSDNQFYVFQKNRTLFLIPGSYGLEDRPAEIDFGDLSGNLDVMYFVKTDGTVGEVLAAKIDGTTKEEKEASKKTLIERYTAENKGYHQLDPTNYNDLLVLLNAYRANLDWDAAAALATNGEASITNQGTEKSEKSTYWYFGDSDLVDEGSVSSVDIHNSLSERMTDKLDPDTAEAKAVAKRHDQLEANLRKANRVNNDGSFSIPKIDSENWYYIIREFYYPVYEGSSSTATKIEVRYMAIARKGNELGTGVGAGNDEYVCWYAPDYSDVYSKYYALFVEAAEYAVENGGDIKKDENGNYYVEVGEDNDKIRVTPNFTSSVTAFFNLHEGNYNKPMIGSEDGVSDVKSDDHGKLYLVAEYFARKDGKLTNVEFIYKDLDDVIIEYLIEKIVEEETTQDPSATKESITNEQVIEAFIAAMQAPEKEGEESSIDLTDIPWYISAKVGGLRVGGLANFAGVKSYDIREGVGDGIFTKSDERISASNVTETALTYFLPTISGTTTKDVAVNAYLGNNGRILVPDSTLVVTKTVSSEGGDSSSELFSFEVEIEGFFGERGAVIVTRDEFNRELWRRRFDTIDVLTDNRNLLLGDDNNLAMVDGNGKRVVEVEKVDENGDTVPDGKTYYLALKGGDGEVIKYAKKSAEGLKVYTEGGKAHLVKVGTYGKLIYIFKNQAGLDKFNETLDDVHKLKEGEYELISAWPKDAATGIVIPDVWTGAALDGEDVYYVYVGDNLRTDQYGDKTLRVFKADVEQDDDEGFVTQNTSNNVLTGLGDIYGNQSLRGGRTYYLTAAQYNALDDEIKGKGVIEIDADDEAEDDSGERAFTEEEWAIIGVIRGSNNPDNPVNPDDSDNSEKSGAFIFHIIAGNTRTDYKPGDREFWINKVYLIPIGDVGGEDEWRDTLAKHEKAYNEKDPDATAETDWRVGNKANGANDKIEESNKEFKLLLNSFKVAHIRTSDTSGATTNTELASNNGFYITSSFLTTKVTFTEGAHKGFGHATITLKHGQGLGFNNIDNKAAYVVTEELTKAQVNADVRFQQVDHVQDGGRRIRYRHSVGSFGEPADYDWYLDWGKLGSDAEIVPVPEWGDQSDSKYTADFSKSNQTGQAKKYSVAGETSPDEQAVHYVNILPGIVKREFSPGAGESVYADDLITYGIRWENFAFNTKAGVPQQSKVTITDVLDPGVTFVSAVFNPLHGNMADTPIVDAENAGDTAEHTFNEDDFLAEYVRMLELQEKENLSEEEEAEIAAWKAADLTLNAGDGTNNAVRAKYYPDKDAIYAAKEAAGSSDGISETPVHGVKDLTYTSEQKKNGYRNEEMTVTVKFEPDPTGVTGGTVTWTLDEAPAGTYGYVELTVRVNVNAAKNWEYDATVKPPEPHSGKWVNDPDRPLDNKVDNCASVTAGVFTHYTDIITNPTGEVKKDETNPGNGYQVMVGQRVDYYVGWGNSTENTATITVEDRLDPGVYFDRAWVGAEKYDAAGAVKISDDEDSFHYDAGNQDKLIGRGSVTMTDEDGKSQPVPVTITYDPESHIITWVLENVPAYYSGRVYFSVIVNEKANFVWDNKDPNPETDKDQLDYSWPAEGDENGEYHLEPTWDNEADLDYRIYNRARVKVNDDNWQYTEVIENPLKPEKKEVIPGDADDDGELDSVVLGQWITYTVTWQNNAVNSEGEPETATVTIVDQLDPGVDFVEASFGTGSKKVTLNASAGDGDVITATSSDGKITISYSKSEHTVTWTFADQAPEATGMVYLTVEVNKRAFENWQYKEDNGDIVQGSGTDEKVVNKAGVKVGNRSTQYTDVVENPVEPGVKKTEPTPGDGKTVTVGQEITYEVTWTNDAVDEDHQPIPAAVTIIDKLDPGVDFAQASFGTGDDQATLNASGGDEDPAPVTSKNGNVTISYSRSEHAVTWVLRNRAAKATGKVELKVNVNSKATLVNDYVYQYDEDAGYSKEYDSNKTPTDWKFEEGSGTDYMVYNQAQVKVENGSDQLTEVVKNPLNPPSNPQTPKSGDPHKTEETPGNGELVKVGDEITYKIHWENDATNASRTANVASTVTVIDKLDPGVDFVSATFGNVTLRASEHAGDGDVITETGRDNRGAVTIEYDKTNHTVTWVLVNRASLRTGGGTGDVYLTVQVNEGAYAGYEYNKQKGNYTNAWNADDDWADGWYLDGPEEEDDWEVENQALVIVENGSKQLTEIPKNPLDNPKKPEKTETDPGDGEMVVVGQEITYEITWKNDAFDRTIGRPAAATVTVIDKLDPGVDFVDAGFTGDDGNGWTGCTVSYDKATHTVIWTMPEREAEAAGTVWLKVKVNERAYEDWHYNKESGQYEQGWDIVSDGDDDWKVVNQARVTVDNGSDQLTNIPENPVDHPEKPEKTETDPGDGEMVVVGQEITYEITWKNDAFDRTIGRPAAATVTVIDKLDPGVDFVDAGFTGDDGNSWTGCTVSYDKATHTVTWTLPNRAAEAEGTVWLKVRVNENARFTYEYNGEDGDDWAIEEGDGIDYKVYNQARIIVENGSDQFTNIPENPVDYPKKPEKTETDPGDGEMVVVGQEITYEISWKNDAFDRTIGRPAAATVTVIDKLDPGVDFVDAGFTGDDGNGWTGCTVSYDKATHTVIWTMPEREAEAAGTVWLKVRVNENARFTYEYNGEDGDDWAIEEGDGLDYEVRNQAQIIVENGSDQFTNIPENPVEPPEKPSKTETDPGNNVEVKVGQEITYEITWKNDAFDRTIGRPAAATVTIIDKLDPGVDFVDAGFTGDDGTGWTGCTVSYDKASHTVTWVLPNREAEAEGTVWLKVKVNENAKYAYEYNGKDGDEGWAIEKGDGEDNMVYNQARIIVENGSDQLTEIPQNPVTPPPEIPQTGDNSHLAFWVALLGLSVVGLAASLLYTVRKINPYNAKDKKRK